MRTTVVIPTYQEALNIERAVRHTRKALPDAAILVVDDNSPDGTADIVDSLAAELGNITVLRRAAPEGLGRAYRAGWAKALDDGAEVVVSMDADASHDPGALPDIVAALDAPADLVMGCRYMPGGSVPGWRRHRRLLSQWGNRYAAFVLRLPVHDATGGYRAYRAELLRKIDLTTIRADGYGFQIELVYRATQLGARVVEIPITFVDRTLGKSKMHMGIVWEALGLVTWWAVRDRVRTGRRGSGG